MNYSYDDEEESENLIENLTIQTIELLTTMSHIQLFKQFLNQGFSEVCLSVFKCLFVTKQHEHLFVNNPNEYFEMDDDEANLKSVR